jgi:hypothetical protein
VPQAADDRGLTADVVRASLPQGAPENFASPAQNAASSASTEKY